MIIRDIEKLPASDFYESNKTIMKKVDDGFLFERGIEARKICGKLIDLSQKVKTVVDDKAKYTDWDKRDDIKAELEVDLIILLAENDYPPVDRDEVYKEIFEQAENFKKYSIS